MEKPVYLRWDGDEELLICTNCGAEYVEGSQCISEWGWCPSCGSTLAWVDDPEKEREYEAERYRARRSVMLASGSLRMQEITLGVVYR